MRFNWRVFLAVIVGMVLILSAAGMLALACMWMFGPNGVLAFSAAMLLVVAATLAVAWER